MFSWVWRKLFPTPPVPVQAPDDPFKLVPPEAGNIDGFYKLFNAYRSDFNRPPLVLDTRLSAVAEQIAQRYAEHDVERLKDVLQQVPDKLVEHGFPDRNVVVVTVEVTPQHGMSTVLSTLFVSDEQYRPFVRSLAYTRIGLDYCLDHRGALCWAVILGDDSPCACRGQTSGTDTWTPAKKTI